MEDADFVVEAFDEAERDLVFRFAVGGDAVPVAIDHVGEALDKVRKAEYARLSGRDRRFIKGQKYNLLTRHENLTLEGKRSLKILLAANKRLNTAYVLKEALGQLSDYGREWARHLDMKMSRSG